MRRVQIVFYVVVLWRRGHLVRLFIWCDTHAPSWLFFTLAMNCIKANPRLHFGIETYVQESKSTKVLGALIGPFWN